MRRFILSAFALFAVSGPALGQAGPFDMSEEAPASASKEIPRRQTTPQRAEPSPVTETRERPYYLLPFGDLELSGEYDRKSWSIYLTAEQAGEPANVQIGFQNAILAAPENSSLTLTINDTLVGESPVDASAGPAERTFSVPAGILRPGNNTISVTARQRHRTDCTIQSTYELWTRLIAEETFLAFDGPSETGTASLDAIRAIGVDAEGLSRFDIIVPQSGQPAASTPLMRLSQGLAMLAGMPNQSFRFSETLPASIGPGQVVVAVGTASELADTLPALPASAAASAFTGFVKHPGSGDPVLTISGPDWQSVTAAIETMVSPVDRQRGVQREALMTGKWAGLDAPLLRADTRLSFSRLGLETSEFSGRRMRTGFVIGVPSDFYAAAYGEARILLDAAYSQEVLPGSHIDIYVNGNIASTVPITSPGGGIFRRLPITVTMRHFKPGANRIEIETVLLTEADRACLPGTPARDEPRFALFDTSEFHMPDFARIAQLPNLAAAAGTGFPYNMADHISLFLNGTDKRTLSAAATFLGKLAIAAGRPLPVASEVSAVAPGKENALFIGDVAQLPPAVTSQIGLAEDTRSLWDGDRTSSVNPANTGAVFDEWRTKVSGGSWRGQMSAFEGWLKRTFDISLGALRFAPSSEMAVVPPESARLVIAQGPSPSGEGTWTVVAAPNADALMNSVFTLSEQARWEQIAGYMTFLSPGEDAIDVRPTNAFTFLPTQPLSLGNIRLIAANWLSSNILSYAVILVGFSLLLGLATAVLLNRLGRGR